jgi:fluoroacetyl-CoA thioesterase
MDFNLKVGLKSQAAEKVTEENTAIKYGSGTVNVFATPAMIGLMEKASIQIVDTLLPKGFATVGTFVNITHIAATPLNMVVIARSELIEIDGKKLKFKIEAFDEKEKIGEGLHGRYIINLQDFIERVEKKKEDLK